MDKVLCSVATRGRYFTTLPLVLNAIITQSKKVDKLVIFDDNDEPQDMRKELIYSYFFQMLDVKGIPWEWVYAEKKGQHHIHQRANTMGFDWVWRVDDDAIPEPDVLQQLFCHVKEGVGAVGGSILTPPYMPDTSKVTGKIDNINNEPNIQWGMIHQETKVEHLPVRAWRRALIGRLPAMGAQSCASRYGRPSHRSLLSRYERDARVDRFPVVTHPYG